MKQGQRSSMSGAVWGVYGATLALMWLGSFSTSVRTWGINWYGYFSWYGPALLVIIGGILPIWLSRQRGWLAAQPGEGDESKPYWPAATLLISVLVLAYVLLSARTHFLGDGYQLISKIETGSALIKPWNMGVYFLVQAIYSLVGGVGEAQAELAFRIVSWLSGLLFLGAAALTAARLYQSRRDRLLFLGGVASGGFALQFFGYVENYPLLILLVAAVTFLGLLAMAGKSSQWWILLPTGAALLVHPFAVALLPAVLYVILRENSVGRWYRSLATGTRRIVWVAAFAVVIAATIWGYKSSLFLRFSLVPLVTNRFTVDGYTLFSLKHLLDFCNLLFLLLPALLLLLWTLISLRGRRLFAIVEYRFLLLLLIPSLLIVFVFDPKLGMPRDWDLFAFAGVPLVTLLFFTLLDVRNKIRGYAVVAALSLALGLLILIPRVFTQVMSETSIAVLDSYLNLDVLKNCSGQYLLLQYYEKHGRPAEKAARERENAILFPHQIWDREGQALFRAGKISPAEAKFRQAVAYAPNFAYSWANIGTCFTRRGQWDSALVYFKIADGLNPFNSDTYNSLGYVYLNLGDLRKAEKYCSAALRVQPSDFLARGNLVKLYRKQDRRNDLVQMLLGLIELDSVPAQYYFEAADQLLQLGESDGATRICRRALEVGVESSLIRQFEADHPGFRFSPADQ
jgi:tetratricopeptide (TPR) repeat protein